MTRYILCSSTFPLRTSNGCSVCYLCWVYFLIPSINRTYNELSFKEGTFLRDVLGCKHYLLPSAFLRVSWYASTLHRLSRLIHSLKPGFFLWEVNENRFRRNVYGNCIGRFIK